MAWKCPECGIKNEAVKECSCGYAFYKILGVKPDASEESVKQTYKYLINVWETDSLSNDPISQKKAAERLKKINEAYKAFKDYASVGDGTKKRIIPVKIAAFAAIIILFLVFLFVFLNTSHEDKPREQTFAKSSDKPETPPSPAGEVNMQNKPEGSKSQPTENLSQSTGTVQQTLPPTVNFPVSANLERTEENAIEMVRKSHIIDPFSDIEAIMKKWTDENAGKLHIIGWKAKKMDEQIYLVSYTASDGIVTKGFYFDVDFSTGAVRHLANHPELQKKYGIQYNQ